MTTYTCRELLANPHNWESIPNELEPMIRTLKSTNAHQLATSILKHIAISHSKNKTKVEGHKLASLAREFHIKAGTLTNSVEANLRRLKNEHPRLVISHQPNIFPSLGVVAPFLLQNVVSNILHDDYGQPVAELYLGLDYDLGNDSRFRVFSFPDACIESGMRSISNGVSKHDSRRLMYSMNKPARSLVVRWIHDISESVKQNLAIIKTSRVLGTGQRSYREFILHNLQLLESIIWQSYDTSTTLVEFNLFFLSQIINNYLGLPICFIPGHLVQKEMLQGYEWFTSKMEEITRYGREASEILFRNNYRSGMNFTDGDMQIWFLCPRCHQRAGTILLANKLMKINSQCSKDQCPANYISPNSPANIINAIKHNMAAKIILDNLLDIRTLAKSGATGYIGQAEHLMISNYIADKLGLDSFPQVAFQPRGIYPGLVEVTMLNSPLLKKKTLGVQQALNQSYSGKASILYYGISLGLNAICQQWIDYFKRGGAINQTNTDINHYPAGISFSVIEQILASDTANGLSLHF